MGRRFGQKRRVLFIFGLCCVAGLTVLLLMPDDIDTISGLDELKIKRAIKMVPYKVEGDLMELELDADNTTIAWIARKTIAGKETNVSGGWKFRFGSQLEGKVVVSNELQILQAAISIDFASLWTEHEILTKMLSKDGFFNVAGHPDALFESTSFEPVGPDQSKLQGATHIITGNFELNDITRSISFPARISIHRDTISVHAAFNLNRKSFDIVLTNPPSGFLLGDDAIDERVAVFIDAEIPVEIAPDQIVKKSINPETVPQVVSTIIAPAKPEPVVESFPEVEQDTGASQKSLPDLESLPTVYTETIPYSLIDFNMVLVPGDPGRGIHTFYMGCCEVTWDEFMPWAIQADVESEIQKGENRAMKLRPSQPWGQVTRGFGEHGFPALSMSRLAAMEYCKWLSRQTGITYRLPTEDEWNHAYLKGGNRLDTLLSENEANDIAIYYENCFNQEILSDATRAVGSKKANALGIFDMAGNVCEWVIPKDSARVARGGHFMSDRDELGSGRHIEDSEKWNLSYPNEPKSIWWFVDAKWLGFRVVCDIESVYSTISGRD